MAIDNTPPRIRLIATIATIVVITLLGLDFVFKSYFAFMTDEAKHEKMAPTTALLAQVVVERDAFAAAKVPLDQAMGQFAKGARPALIEPTPSEDLAPMTGWSKMPKQLPLPAPATAGPAHTDGVVAVPTDDAGATSATDAGATRMDNHDNHAADSGAPKGPGAAKDAGAHAP